MDPLSISASALGIATALFKVSEKIYSFTKATRDVDRTVQSFQKQVEGVANVLSSLGTTLEGPLVSQETLSNRELWRHVGKSVDDCNITTSEIASILDKYDAQGSNQFKQAWRTFKLGLAQDEIDRYLDAMRTHSINLQLSLGNVNLLLSASSPEITTNNLVPRFERLERMITAIDLRLQLTASEQIPSSDSTLVGIVLNENTRNLRRAADSIMNTASTVSGGTVIPSTGRTFTGDSGPAFDYFEANLNDLGDEMRSTTGSELGKPLSNNQKADIHSWMQVIPRIEEQTEQGTSSSKSPDPDSVFGGKSVFSETQATEFSAELFDASSDDEDEEFMVAQSLISRANSEFGNKDFQTAETIFRKAIQQTLRLNQKQQKALDTKDMQLKYAVCKSSIGDLDESEQMLLLIAREPVQTAADAKRYFEATHNLAIIHLRKRNLQAAENHCRQAYRGRGKTKTIGKLHEDYYASIRLYAVILWAQGDQERALAFADLLPDDKKIDSAALVQILQSDFPIDPALEKSESQGSFSSIDDNDLKRNQTPERKVEPPETPRSYEHALPVRQVVSTDTSISGNQPSNAQRNPVAEQNVRQQRGEPIRPVALNAPASQAVPTSSVPATSSTSRASLWNRMLGKEEVAKAHRTIKGHTKKVVAVAFSPNGRRLASGSDDRTIKIWETTTGREIHSMKGHTGRIWSLAFSPDGETLASASEDKTIKLWNPSLGTEKLTLSRHTKEVLSIAFHPDGRRLASGSHDRTIKIWDIAVGRQELTIEGHANWVWWVIFSPNGQHLASGSWDGTIKLWTATGVHQRTIHAHTDRVASLSFSYDSRYLVSGSDDTTVKLWDVTTGAELLSIKNKSCIFTVCFSSDGQYIVYGSKDGTIRLWNVRTRREQFGMLAHTDWVETVTFSPGGHFIASASADKTIKLWDLRTNLAQV